MQYLEKQWKILENRDIKLVTTNKKRNKLVSEPNYHTINYINYHTNKTKVKVNKPIYLGLSILDISKVLMYEFWYDYMKPKYVNRVKLCYMDTDSFVMNIKTNDFYKDIANDVEKRFDTSNYECNRPFPIGKNKKVIGLMKDELGGKIITELVTLRPKTYSYLTNDGKEDKKAKGTKKVRNKKMIKFDDFDNPHAFIEYSNNMNDVLDDINNYNKNRDRKVLIIFDDVIADIMRSENFKAIVKELFVRCRK